MSTRLYVTGDVGPIKPTISVEWRLIDRVTPALDTLRARLIVGPPMYVGGTTAYVRRYGRRHRSGHKHFGTRAWARRYAHR